MMDTTSNQQSVWNLTLTEYIEKASKTPATITGGCVSICEGVIAISLLRLTIEVTSHKEKNANKKLALAKFADTLLEKQNVLKQLADSDLTIFHQFLVDGKLPSYTQQEIRYKASVTYEALLHATASPLKSAQIMLDAIEIELQSVPYISSNVISDIGASSHLLGAALNAVLLLAKDNINQLRNEDKADFLKTYWLLKKRNDVCLNKILAAVNSQQKA